jgi:hypothetical protein
MSSEVLLAVSAGIVSVVGWFVTYFLAKRREDDTRRLERTVRRVERQIEEFYGPLFNLVHQVVIANHVQHKILAGAGTGKLDRDKAEAVRRFFRERYFFPVHAEIIQILKTRLHLAEGAAMPEVFYRYVRHAVQEQAQSALWQNDQVDTSFVPGEPYPNDFYQAVKAGLDRLMVEYDRLTRALAAGQLGRAAQMRGRQADEDRPAELSAADDRGGK